MLESLFFMQLKGKNKKAPISRDLINYLFLFTPGFSSKTSLL